MGTARLWVGAVLAASGLLVVTACAHPAGLPASTLTNGERPWSVPCPADQGTPISGVPVTVLPCLSSGDVRVSAVHGRPEVLNIWASWCAPCQRETPMLEAAHRSLGARVLFLGVDTRDDRGDAVRFLAAHSVSYPQAYDKAATLAARLGLPGVPATLVLDANGRVVYRRVGELSAGELTAALARVGIPAVSRQTGTGALSTHMEPVT